MAKFSHSSTRHFYEKEMAKKNLRPLDGYQHSVRIPAHVKINEDRIKRFYYNDMRKFRQLLDVYNLIMVKDRGMLKNTGRLNVSLKMCSRCGDSGKMKGKMEDYFVYLNEKEHSRTIFCLGCLGYHLKMFETERLCKIDSMWRPLESQTDST